MRTNDIPKYREKFNELNSMDALAKVDINVKNFMGKLFFEKSYANLSEEQQNVLGLKLYDAFDAQEHDRKLARDMEILFDNLKKEKNTYTLPKDVYLAVANQIKDEKLLKTIPRKTA
jgi:hypothetical protein